MASYQTSPREVLEQPYTIGGGVVVVSLEPPEPPDPPPPVLPLKSTIGCGKYVEVTKPFCQPTTTVWAV